MLLLACTPRAHAGASDLCFACYNGTCAAQALDPARCTRCVADNRERALSSGGR